MGGLFLRVEAARFFGRGARRARAAAPLFIARHLFLVAKQAYMPYA